MSQSRESKPRLLIADHPVTRLGVRIALESVVNVCAEADDAEHAIGVAEREQPNICLVGLGLPGGGIHATREICRVAPASAVIVLATAPDVDDLLSCIQAGAVGYLASDVSAVALCRAVEGVVAGEAAVSRAMVLNLVRELQGASAVGGTLTAREKQVLAMVRRGRSTSAIADQLGISPVTVRRHISGTMQKVGVDRRSALARAQVIDQPAKRGGRARGSGR